MIRVGPESDRAGTLAAPRTASFAIGVTVALVPEGLLHRDVVARAGG